MLLKKSLLTKRQGFNALLIISFLLFLMKGADYLLLGRFLPIALGIVLILLFWMGIQFSQQLYKLVIMIWSVALIGWSIIRLLLAAAVHFTTGIDEFHVRSQFGFWGITISLLFLAIGTSILVHRPWRYFQK